MKTFKIVLMVFWILATGSVHAQDDNLTMTLEPDILQDALQRAQNFKGGNEAWTPYEHTFDDDVTMVLVPAGCFVMGSNDGPGDERPANKQCFDEPFWIDRTEVTQADFVRLGGTAATNNDFAGSQFPVQGITWFEARDYCQLRRGRLPTEAEWEYAARGPDSLVYPWGNTWNALNAAWDQGNSAVWPVGLISAGISWVGALDMIGNLWEWTNSIYSPYPYDANDGREENSDDTTLLRELRGGSYSVSSEILLRAPDRGGGHGVRPDYGYSDFGFRCARSL